MEWGRSNGKKVLWFSSIGIPANDYQEAIAFCQRFIDEKSEMLHCLSGRDYYEALSSIRMHEDFIRQINIKELDSILAS